MKKIVVSLILVSGLSGCLSAGGPTPQQSAVILPGMTMTQVEAIYGNPASFSLSSDGDAQCRIYKGGMTTSGAVTVTYVEGKVVDVVQLSIGYCNAPHKDLNGRWSY